jgi:N-acylglucosamine-6-phosphate 2-epimerase
MRIATVFTPLYQGLIVSCQALADEPLYGAQHMAVMARAAELGGAVGIRANSPQDIAAIRAAVELPIIGLDKQVVPGYEPYITPTLRSALGVAQAGADVIALDATLRPHPDDLSAAELIRSVRAATGKAILADVDTFEAGLAAVEAGADAISTTLSGYTPGSPSQPGPDFELLERLVSAVDVPVLAEGRIETPEQAQRALQLGAYAVVVGGAITRPQLITRRFVRQMQPMSPGGE